MADSKNSDARAPDPEEGDWAADPSKKPIPEIKPVDIDHLSRLRQARRDRIAQIKAQIDAGQYESEELLDAAMERMLGRVDLTGEEGEEENP